MGIMKARYEEFNAAAAQAAAIMADRQAAAQRAAAFASERTAYIAADAARESIVIEPIAAIHATSATPAAPLATPEVVAAALELTKVQRLHAKVFAARKESWRVKRVVDTTPLLTYAAMLPELHAAAAQDGAALWALMQKRCENNVIRFLRKRWGLFVVRTSEEWQDVVQEIAVMLLDAAPMRYGAFIVELETLPCDMLYWALTGRAQRAAMHRYELTTNRRVLLSAAKSADGKVIKGRFVYKVLSLDAACGSSHSAESAYITQLQDESAALELERMENNADNTPAAAAAILAGLTPAERAAFARLARGESYHGCMIDRVIKRLKAAAEGGWFHADMIPELCRAAIAATPASRLSAM